MSGVFSRFNNKQHLPNKLPNKLKILLNARFIVSESVTHITWKPDLFTRLLILYKHSVLSCFYNKQTSSNKLKISNESLILCDLTQFILRARSISIESSRRGYSRYFLNFWSQKVIWPGRATQ